MPMLAPGPCRPGTPPFLSRRRERPAAGPADGIGSAAASFRYQVETLSPQLRVIAWDAPGYGASTRLATEHPDASHYVAALDSWLGASGNRRAFRGHSLLNSRTRQHTRAMFHDAGYFGGVDAVALYPGSDGEEVWVADRVLVTHHPRTLHELMFDQLKAFHHVRWYFAPHCLDGCGVIRPSGAAHTMCVRDMYGRAKITIELLNLCKGERIREGGEFGVRETLCHKAQQRGGFRECAALGHQRGNAPFRVDREVFGAPLALGTEIDENGLVGRTGLFKRDVRRERTRAGSIVKPEHGVRPSIDHNCA